MVTFMKERRPSFFYYYNDEKEEENDIAQKNSYPLQKMSRHEEIHGVVLNNGFIVVHDDDFDVKVGIIL